MPDLTAISAAATSSPEVDYHGARLRAWHSDAVAEHQAVRSAAGLIDRAFRVMFSARGSDRARFLHSMTTNDVKGLAPGRGLYATLLDVRGHILADLEIYCEADQFLITTDADLIEKTLATLGKYNIGGRVPLDRLPLVAISVEGPKSGAVLREVLPGPLPEPGEFIGVAGGPLRVMRSSSTGEEGYELWAAPEEIEPLRRALLEKGQAHGLVPCGACALETLRIEAGIPKYGSELAEDTLPLEAGLDGSQGLPNALSFTKGCYIGQEIVERARSRGRVNWKLMGLFVEATEAPAPGEKILKEGNPVGEITSACVSPTLARTLSMAYLRREVAQPGTRVMLASGAEAEVTNLPFYRRPNQ